MRKISFSVLLFLFAVTAMAQSKVRVGIKGGANYSTLALKGNSPTINDITEKVGFLAGMFVNIPAGTKFSVQPEIFYSQMGAYINNKTLLQSQYRLNYLSVPLLAKVNLTKHLSLIAGPQADVVVGATKVVNAGRQNALSDFKESSFAGVAGFELWPAQRLGLSARYIYGFSNISKTAGEELYNRAGQLALHIAFFKKPVVKPAVVVVPEPEVKPQPRPVDTDGDGIPDAEDKCPEVKGIAKYNGCPVPDTDKDGINDEEDKCPTVPGVARYGGCPVPDTDKDGVNDEEDKCPTLPGTAANNGCPEIKQEIMKRVEYAAQRIYFATGSAKLLAKSFKSLDDVARILTEDQNLKLSIEGHTDNVGKDDYNQRLSEARAGSVKAYFIKKGISESRLTSQGFGETQPIADNKTAAGRSKNRRVVMKPSYQ